LLFLRQNEVLPTRFELIRPGLLCHWCIT